MYAEIPLNYDQIQNYITEDSSCLIPHLQKQKKLIFYDTCSFHKHAKLPQPDSLFAYFRQANALIIITRCILMELASTSKLLHENCITYFKQLHHAGIPVLILYEEDMFPIMEHFFSGSMHINKFLFWAVTTIKPKAGTINLTILNTPALYKNLMVETSSERTLYQLFFRSVRKNKEPDDNLGEQLLAICVHILSNIPFCKKCQYLIFTEDKGALSLIGKAMSKSYEQLQQYNFSAVTSVKLAQHLFCQGMLSSLEQLITFLSTGTKEETITFFGSGPYDLAPQKMTLPVPELAKKIATPGAIHINY